MIAELEFTKFPNIELRTIEGKGRCIFSAAHFNKGDVIFEEDPLISCQFAWNKAYEYSACDHCMRPLESVEENITRLSGGESYQLELSFLEYSPNEKFSHVKCSNCEEMYCSEKCLMNAYKQYHQFLCHRNVENEPLVQLVERWKKIHYPPETTNIMLLARMIATIIMAENKESAYNTFMQFCHLSHSDGETLAETFAHNLLGKQYQYDIDELWQMFATAIRARCGQEINAVVETLLTREGFLRMLSLIGRNGQGIGTSVLAKWANTVNNLELPSSEGANRDQLIDAIYDCIEKHAGSFINNEGSGLYMVQSCINHSCEANAKVTFPFNNGRLALIAKREILPGEEIFINYLDKCSRKRSCHSRRKILRDHYLFICKCTKCTVDSSNEPDVTSEDEESEEDDGDYEMM